QERDVIGVEALGPVGDQDAQRMLAQDAVEFLGAGFGEMGGQVHDVGAGVWCQVGGAMSGQMSNVLADVPSRSGYDSFDPPGSEDRTPVTGGSEFEPVDRVDGGPRDAELVLGKSGVIGPVALVGPVSPVGTVRNGQSRTGRSRRQ